MIAVCIVLFVVGFFAGDIVGRFREWNEDNEDQNGQP